MHVNPPGKRIGPAWVFVSIDADGDEGVPAFGPVVAGDEAVWVPLVAFDERRRDLLAEMVRQEVAACPGIRVEVRLYPGTYTIDQVIE